jgi:hypothetical protein
MFGRQWFSPQSQIGLSDPALKVRALIEKHAFCSADEMIKQECRTNTPYWRRQYKRLDHMRTRQILESLEGPQPIKVFFSGFWPKMNIHNCQLHDFLRIASPNRIIQIEQNPSIADISFFTCYGNYTGLKESEQSLRILFLGENVRPSYEHFDLSFSSDFATYSGLNAYLPLWLLEINWFNKQYEDRNTYPLDLFTKDRTLNHINRVKYIVYVGNNHEPFRIATLKKLEELGFKIDSFGQQTKPVTDKIKLYSQYKYAFCPENSYHPGYVTEKLMHSYIAGCIPIYWGCLDSLPFRDHPMIINMKTHDISCEQLNRDILNIELLSQSDFNYPRLMQREYVLKIFNNATSFISKNLEQFATCS